jgi:hypothetical protein
VYDHHHYHHHHLHHHDPQTSCPLLVHPRAALLDCIAALVRAPAAEARTLHKCAEALCGIAQDEQCADALTILRLTHALEKKCREPDVEYLVGEGEEWCWGELG